MVQKIFELYLSGYSILGIIRYLEEKKIASPSGKPKWSKRSVELLLSNEKYIGNVIVGKTYCDEYPNNQRRINKGEQKKYLLRDSHEPINLKQFKRKSYGAVIYKFPRVAFPEKRRITA